MYLHAIQLGDEEEVVAYFRRHWFHIAIRAAGDIALFVMVAIGIVFAGAFLSSGNAGMTLSEVLPLGLYTLAFLGLVLWMHFFAAWSDHWLDIWIVTNKRVIDIEQHGFFRREVSSFPLDRIQDVTYDVSGVIATWLKFGDVRIQTASISDTFIMRQVPFPEDVKKAITGAMRR